MSGLFSFAAAVAWFYWSWRAYELFWGVDWLTSLMAIGGCALCGIRSLLDALEGARA